MPQNATPIEPVGWNSKLVDWFISNTKVAVLLFLMLVIGGAFSLMSLRSEGFPSPTISLAIVTDLYKGASPTEVEAQVVKPLEAAVKGIAGVTQVTSSASNSFGTLAIQVDATSDFKSVLAEIRSQVQNVQLPKDAEKPEITVPTFGGNFSYYAITGIGEAASLRTLGEQIRLDLEAVAGVKDFTLVSPINDQLSVTLKPEELARNGLTMLDVQQVLQANNVTIPAGTLTVDGTNASVVTVGSLSSQAQLEDTLLKPGVQLKDVATITKAYDYTSLSRTVGYKAADDKEGQLSLKTALIYQLTYASDQSVLKVEPEVAKVLERNRVAIEAQGGNLVTLLDVAVQIRHQVDEIREGAIGLKIGDTPVGYLGYLLGGIWLIVIVMLAFVSWRAALISAIAVPVSLLFTFLALRVQDVSLNTLTLFSMVLVLGLIVDPAIVVLESIQRELDMGKKGRDAVIAAMNTVGLGVFMAVLTSIIVFIPFGVVSGIFGQIIKYIPITIIPALVASYFVPVLFLTFLAQKYLKPSRSLKPRDHESLEDLWKISRWFVRVNLAIGRRRWAQVVVVILAVVAPLAISGSLFATGKIVPVQFSAPNDSEAINVTLEFPAAMSREKKEALVSQLEQRLVKETYVQRYFPLQQMDTSIVYQAELLPRDLRDSDSPALATSLSQALSQDMGKSAEGIYLSAKSADIAIPEAAFPVSLNIYGDNLDALKKAAIKTGDLLREHDKVTRVEDGFTGANNPQIAIILDRQKLGELNLPAAQVAGVMTSVIGTSTVTKFEQQIDGATRNTEVILGYAAKPSNVEEIANTVVGASAKGIVRLKDVATVEQTNGFAGIQRLNGSRYVTVQAQVKDKLKDATPVQNDINAFWTESKLAEFGLRSDALQNHGSSDEFVESFSDLFLALGVALILLYVVLVVFLKSFAQPLIILMAVPLTFVGVFPALASIGGQFGFLEILGIITLSGIVVNVGIFVLDLANQKRAAGMDYKQAIAEATGIRFRAIWLTKVTTLAGLAPLIVLSPFWRSLALVVVSGVLVSGFLSLFTTPVLYIWLIDFKQFLERVSTGIRRRFSRA